jgi:hypothetical protein
MENMWIYTLIARGHIQLAFAVSLLVKPSRFSNNFYLFAVARR